MSREYTAPMGSGVRMVGHPGDLSGRPHPAPMSTDSPALLDDPADLCELRATGDDPDELFASFAAWADECGTPLYPAQQDALIELLGGANVILATTTGSGKSLVATGAQYAALAQGQRSYYTAPIKALVSEKFFALCAVFGPGNVGMLTGDAAVNAGAPIIACTAEILANIALREGAEADIGLVVMDEFHFYGDPDRGWRRGCGHAASGAARSARPAWRAAAAARCWPGPARARPAATPAAASALTQAAGRSAVRSTR